MLQRDQNWDWEITSETSWLGGSLKEIYHYKDLLIRLVRKDFLASFQQTLLGPLWVILQPLLTVLTYIFVFRNLMNLSTEGFPSFLYYLIGITLWNLFSELFLNISFTFLQNMPVYSKVYFPRIIAPLASVLLYLLRFSIQLIFLLIVYIYFAFTSDIDFNIFRLLLIFPAIFLTTGIGFGLGLIFSIFSTKYKDLIGLLQLITRLLMFVCPIFYSLSMVPDKVKWMVNINPLAQVFELFRYSFLGKGQIEAFPIIYSLVVTILLVLGGMMLFNKMGDKLMDVA
jgi:lipopolysaccharide transport system permease protein